MKPECLFETIWRYIILPYLTCHERHPLGWINEVDQSRSIQNTIELELINLMGSHRWFNILKPALIQSQAVIAGSGPYQAITGRQFPYSRDWDIFVGVTDADIKSWKPHDQDTTLNAVGENHPAFYVTPLEHAIYHSGGAFTHFHTMRGDLISYTRDSGHPIQTVRDYRITTTHHAHRTDTRGTDKFIQVIQINMSEVKDKTVAEWVQSSFDFDCCKFAYCPGDTNTPIRYPIAKFDSLIQGRDVFNYHTRLDASLRRMKKYQDRGIVFDISEDEKKQLYTRVMTDLQQKRVHFEERIIQVKLVSENDTTGRYSVITGLDDLEGLSFAGSYGWTISKLDTTNGTPTLNKRKRDRNTEYEVTVRHDSISGCKEDHAVCILRYCGKPHVHCGALMGGTILVWDDERKETNEPCHKKPRLTR